LPFSLSTIIVEFTPLELEELEPEFAVLELAELELESPPAPPAPPAPPVALFFIFVEDHVTVFFSIAPTFKNVGVP